MIDDLRTLAFAVAAALPVAAVAQASPQGATQAAAAPAAPAGATLNQIVVRDAATGQLRAATAEEAQALQGKVQARRVAPQNLTRSHPSGAVGARLSDDFMSYAVLVRQADGTLVEHFYDSRAQAEAAVRAGAPKPSTLPTE